METHDEASPPDEFFDNLVPFEGTLGNALEEKDIIITLKPNLPPEAEDRFLGELASALYAIARHVVDKEDSPGQKED